MNESEHRYAERILWIIVVSFRPRLSPDGNKIVFCGGYAQEQPSGFNLITINIDGTDITNMTDFTIDACEWPDW